MGLQELLITTFIAAILADVSMVFGVVPFFFVKNMSDKVTGIFAAAAAGMMAAASLVQLVGEGLARAPGFQVWEVAAGLLAGALLYAGITTWVRGHDQFDIMKLRQSGGTQSLLIVAAMTVHSAPEGVAIGVAFGSQEMSLGYSIVAAMAVHNIPEALAITLALRANNVPIRSCLGWALFTSLPQPVFAPFAAWFMWIFEPLLPAGMGFAAGAMTFLVINDLIPEALAKTSRTQVATAFMGGLVLMIILGRLVGL